MEFEQATLDFPAYEQVDAPLTVVPQSVAGLVVDDLGVGSPELLETAQKIVRAKEGICRLFDRGHPVCVAYSAGKDSSVMLSLVLTAAVEYQEAGGRVPQILVTHANTGIENPAYQVVINHEIGRVKEFAAANGLPVRVDVATPYLNDSWAVRIISGRALPTFANSATRDCSISWKIKPQERQRKLALRELENDGTPVVLVGTRFEESTSRAARMKERGESDVEIWQQEIRDAKSGKLTRVENRMSPVAWWSDEDIWVYMHQLGTGHIQSFTDGKEIWDAYAAGGGGGSCAAIGDGVLKENAKACGARFGCALCTAVGRDKSLESMIESDPAYGYLRQLNRLQRFLVDTQNNWALRDWLGRTIDKDGFIAIEPDTYSPGMSAFLLGIALTIDLEEREAAWKLGIEPRFQLVTDQQLVAIDAIWSAQAKHKRPFAAIKVWDEVVNQGRRFYAPSASKADFTEKKPETRYLYVGHFDDPVEGGLRVGDGLYDPIAEMAGVGEAREFALESMRLRIKDRIAAGESISAAEQRRLMVEAAERAGGCIGFRTLSDGRRVTDVPISDMFEIDAEGAALFLTFEAERVLQEFNETKCPVPTSAYHYYTRLGVVSTSSKHVGTIDDMLRRSNWKIRHEVHGMTRAELLSRSISRDERRHGLKAPEGQQTLHDKYLESPQVQTELRYAALLRRWEHQDSSDKETGTSPRERLSA